MGISALFFLIIGIFFIILGILTINHYRLHPEKEGALISILIPFILGIIGIISAITGYIWLIILSLFIIGIIHHIYSKYISIKYPEMKKKQEKSREIAKKHPLYKFVRISQYMMLAVAISWGIFILIIVVFDITF